MFKESQINQRLRNLKKRLKEENPVLSKVVDSFRELDQISRRLGYFDKEQSHAIRTSWWQRFLAMIRQLFGCGEPGT